ncbi:MAG: hypothetical protein IKH36_00565 [Bacilli bacterium]|nr:hypothetical protein [Bacilli bacterium]
MGVLDLARKEKLKKDINELDKRIYKTTINNVNITGYKIFFEDLVILYLYLLKITGKNIPKGEIIKYDTLISFGGFLTNTMSKNGILAILDLNEDKIIDFYLNNNMYFKRKENDNIEIKEDISITDLCSNFITYIPYEVFNTLLETRNIALDEEKRNALKKNYY